jgi:hypothetical protein
VKDVTKQEAVRLGAKAAMDPGLGLIVERHAPHLTVCPACRADDWCHVEGCEVAERIEVAAAWLEAGEPGDMPWELGTLIYVDGRDE